MANDQTTATMTGVVIARYRIEFNEEDFPGCMPEEIFAELQDMMKDAGDVLQDAAGAATVEHEYFSSIEVREPESDESDEDDSDEDDPIDEPLEEDALDTEEKEEEETETLGMIL